MRCLLFRLGQIVLHQVQLTEVFARAEVFGVQRQRAAVMFQCNVEIARIALGVTQQVMGIGIVVVAFGGGIQRGNGARPVLGGDGGLAGSVIGIGFATAGSGASAVSIARAGGT